MQAAGAMLVLAACQGVAAPDLATPDGSATTQPVASARPQLSRDRDAGIDIVYQGRGLEAIAMPGRVVVLEADLAHLHAVEPGSGEIAWRIRVPAQPGESHALVADGYRVLLHSGSHLSVVDARDGRILGRDDDVAPSGTHAVVAHDGGCAVIGACTIDVFDCTEAARIRDRMGVATRECDYAPRVLGGAGDATLVVAPRDDGAEIVAVTPPGRPGWIAPMTAAPQFHAGVVGDRDAVWLVDDARVLVRRVSNGDERWRATLGFRVQHVAVHDDLLVVVGRTPQRVVAIGFDIGSGQERWRKRFSPRRKVILRGEDPPVDDAGGLRIYEIVDPRTGAGLGRVAKARDELLWRDVSEGYVRTGGDIEELGPDGALRRQQPFTGGDVLAIGATHLVSRSGQDLLFHDRIALLERARLSRGFTVDPSSGRLGPHRMLLRRTDEAGVLFVIVALEPTTRG